jgi:hypothetical protein
VSLRGLEGHLREKLADWRGLLQRHMPEARAVLPTLLVGPLTFTPVDDGRRRGYEFRGTISIDRLLAGVIDLPMRTRAEDMSPTHLVQRGAVGGWLRRAA